MLTLLRNFIVIPLKKNLFILNFVTRLLYSFGFISYKFHQLFKKPYFGFYLFSNQENFRGRQKIISQVLKSQLVKEDISILEIGVYCGQTTVNIGSCFKSHKKKFTIEVVDLWDKVETDNNDHINNFFFRYRYKNLKNNNVESLFDENINFSKLDEFIKKNKCDSKSFFLKNNKKFDVIIIDASHYYEDVKLDLMESKKILKEGGIIIIDDYELDVSKISFEELYKLKNIDTDFFTKNIQFHPGVTLAVKENFNFKLSEKNGLGVVTLKNDQFEDFFS